MPFTFKLSQRLARMRCAAVLLSTAALAACERPIIDPGQVSTEPVVVIVSPETVTVLPSQSQQFSAFGRNAAGDSIAVAVIWSASAGSISASGLYVAGPTEGDYAVTAQEARGSRSGTGRVKVRKMSVASVTVSPATASVTAGQTVQLTATLTGANGTVLSGRTVAWGSDNPGVATVSGSGAVSGVTAGSAAITATSEGMSGAATVTVTVATVPVASVAVSPATPSVTVGQTVQLTATPKDASGSPLSGRPVTWQSGNTSVATVNSSGLVTGVTAGSATITATSEGKTGTATVAVTAPPPAPVASVAVSPATSSVTAGQTVQLTATLQDANGTVLSGRTVTWGSDNPGVATVSSSGLVRGVTAGSATITATSEGKSGTSAVTVTAGSAAGECGTPQAGWIWCDDFEQDRLSQYFEYDNSGGGFVRAAGGGVGGSAGMRARFAAGQVDAGSLHLAFGKVPSSYFRTVDAGTASYRDVYWRMYVRNQPGWVGGGGYKLSRAISFASANWAEAMIAQLWGDPPATGALYMDPASGTDAAGNLLSTQYNDWPNLRWLGAQAGATSLFDASHVGQWYCVEAHARLNDAGQTNGVFEFWVNGNVDARATGLNWVGSYSAYGINAVFFENYWNTGSPVAQERYFDNLVVSTQRIGC